MSRPAIGGRVFTAGSPVDRFLTLDAMLRRTMGDLMFIARMASDPNSDINRTQVEGDIFSAVQSWKPLYTEILLGLVESVRDTADHVLEVFAEQEATDRERQLIKHLREANYEGPEGENAKRLADIREAKLEGSA
jgi:hypothetical protein